MPFHSTTIYHISIAASSVTCSSSTTKKKHYLNMLSSKTNALLMHTLASFWRKQSCYFNLTVLEYSLTDFQGLVAETLNYANPVYGVATICHQVSWLRWGHPSFFHTATFLLIWYKMFCVRDISYRLIWMEFINMFSVYAQSGMHSHFNW